jgi:hypothetical protein
VLLVLLMHMRIVLVVDCGTMLGWRTNEPTSRSLLLLLRNHSLLRSPRCQN